MSQDEQQAQRQDYEEDRSACGCEWSGVLGVEMKTLPVNWAGMNFASRIIPTGMGPIDVAWLGRGVGPEPN